MSALPFSVSEPVGGPAATLVAVEEASQVGEVRRTAAALALAAGLGEVERGALAVVATELATNLARHARRGRVLLRTVHRAGAGGARVAGVELLTLDEGPGIASVARAMEDGYSTGGTAGAGLGAVQRLAGEFDLYTRPGDGGGAGTAMVARVWSAAGVGPGGRREGVERDPLRAGVVCVALAGERACGDAWLVLPQRDRTLVVVVDGLGHGPEAAAAASEAVRVVRERADAGPAELVQAAHLALRATRGAAMAVAAVQPAAGTVLFAGVGNVSAAVHAGGGARGLASHNGTVGHAMRTLQEFRADWPRDAALVMHSDGVNTRWRLDAYPGIARHDPTLLAGLLYRDAARGRDDATVVVARDGGA